MAITMSPERQLLLLELAQQTQKAALATPAEVPEEIIAWRNAEAEVDNQRKVADSAALALADMEQELLRVQKEEGLLRRRLREARKSLGATQEQEARRDALHDIRVTQTRLGDITGEIQEAHNELHALRAHVDSCGARLDSAIAQAERAKRAAEAVEQPDPRAQAQAELEELRQRMPAEILEFFQQREAHSDTPVSKLVGNTCQGCFIQLPPSVAQELRDMPADALAECPDCGALLIRSS